MISIEKCTNSLIWNEYLKGKTDCQQITIGHNPSMAEILSKTFNYKNSNFLVKCEKKIIGILPGTIIGNKFVSMPHFSYGGPIMSDWNEWEKLLKAFPFKNYEIRSFRNLSSFFNDNKVVCVLPLQNSPDLQWNNFRSKLRSQIKKGLSYEFDVKNGQIELLNDFYFIYSTNMLRLGSPPLPHQFFKNLLLFYKYGNATIIVVYDKNIPIASGFKLSYLGFEEVCWASADIRYKQYQPNMVLYWELIKNSILTDNKNFSFGRSTKNSGTYKFKKQWDPIEKQLYFNYSQSKTVNIKNYLWLTEIWKKQPLWTSQVLGKIISKYVY